MSERARTTPSAAVIERVDAQDSSSLAITAIDAADVRAGIALPPGGRRKRDVGLWMESFLSETFAGFVRAFDIGSSALYADILLGRRHAGRPICTVNAQIARPEAGSSCRRPVTVEI